MSIILTTTSLLLAQASMDTPLKSFTDFLAKVGLLIGICCIIAGGYRIAGRGETDSGLLAIVGGMIIALSVPIIRFLAGLGGITF